jgi:hypothetical protein
MPKQVHVDVDKIPEFSEYGKKLFESHGLDVEVRSILSSNLTSYIMRLKSKALRSENALTIQVSSASSSDLGMVWRTPSSIIDLVRWMTNLPRPDTLNMIRALPALGDALEQRGFHKVETGAALVLFLEGMMLLDVSTQYYREEMAKLFVRSAAVASVANLTYDQRTAMLTRSIDDFAAFMTALGEGAPFTLVLETYPLLPQYLTQA